MDDFLFPLILFVIFIGIPIVVGLLIYIIPKNWDTQGLQDLCYLPMVLFAYYLHVIYFLVIIFSQNLMRSN